MFNTDKEEVVKINKYLDLQEHNFIGQPIFRVVLADDQWEMREGTYNEFTKGTNLFIRTVYGVKRTSKYPHLKGIWILEQWFEQTRVRTELVKDHNGYECIYAFRNTRNFEPLPVLLRVVELILRAKRARNNSMLSKSRMIQFDEDKEKRLDAYTYDAIDPRSPIEASLHAGDGISFAGIDVDKVFTKKGK
jgi:hypothetical protein